MEPLILEDPLEKLISLSKTRKPQRVKIHNHQFIILPNLPEDVLTELEYFLEDYLDKDDSKLKEEVNQARAQIAQEDYLSHEDVWQETE